MKAKTCLKYEESQKFRDGKISLKIQNLLCFHVFNSSLRLKHRMSLIQRALDRPGVVDYFSNLYHGQKVRKKCLESFEGTNLPQR